MSNSKPISHASILFSFLFTAVFLQHIAAEEPLYQFCFGSKYTSGSSFGGNMKTLINFLSFQAPYDPSGFKYLSYGKSETVYGLALCRSDSSQKACRECLNSAKKKLPDVCPNSKGSVIWYDGCMLKYSDAYFYGQIDNQNRFCMYNTASVDDPKSFDGMVNGALKSASYKAAGSEKMYATGEKEVVVGQKSEKVYALAQCTRDLTSSDCTKCLDDAISVVPYCSAGKRGGRVVGGSCTIRYELYPFYSH